MMTPTYFEGFLSLFSFALHVRHSLYYIKFMIFLQTFRRNPLRKGVCSRTLNCRKNISNQVAAENSGMEPDSIDAAVEKKL